LLSHCAELRYQFKQRHSREDFLGLIRKSQTFFGAMPVFLRRWHGDIPTSPRINLFQRILLIGDGSAARTAFGWTGHTSVAGGVAGSRCRSVSRTLRTLRTMCEPVERVPPHGAWLWRLRNSGDD